MTFIEDFMEYDASFLDQIGDFRETITYTPKGGTPKTIQAEVVRNRPIRAEETGEGAARDIEVTIRNDAVTGITSVDVRGDTITCAERVNGTNKTFHVIEIVYQDKAMWQVKIR